MHAHEHHHPADHGHQAFESPEAVAFAELDGEVLGDLAATAVATLAGLCDRHGVDVRRVLDLGAGPGIGTCHLAERFASATVVAVDGSATMLERAVARAARRGLAGRVEVRRADLAADLGSLGRADVAWASMSLHHVADEVAALREVHGLLAPGGLLAVVERAGPPRVLPDGVDLGRPGLWERLDAAWAAWSAEARADLPGATPTAEPAALLGRAGFDVVADEVLTLELPAPDDRARRYARRHVEGARAQLVPHADPADLAALDVLVDDDAGEGILSRADAVLSVSRRLSVGRAAPAPSPRPGG